MDPYKLNIIKTYALAKNKYRDLLKYNLNILDEIHANENAHTRILLKLLNYENQNEEKVFLKLFISYLNAELNCQERISDENLNCYDIAGQIAYIDGYITSDSSVIIIENKINNAVDQYHQLENYIKTSLHQNYKPEQIFVVYLTENGYKKASDESLTQEAKNWLGYKSEQQKGRFIEINYREHILLFLEKCYEATPPDEKILKSALLQYIDYLEGRFGIRRSDMNYNENMDKEITNVLNLNDLPPQERFETIEKIKNEFIRIFDRIKFEPRKTIAKKIIEHYEQTDMLQIFNKPIIWIDAVKEIVLVFPGYEINGFKYKLDVNIGFDSFMLKFKQDDNQSSIDEKFSNFLQNHGFNAQHEQIVASNSFEETNCLLKTKLDELFTDLKKEK